MLLLIDWQGYGSLIVLVAICYYALLFSKYFRLEIRKLANWVSQDNDHTSVEKQPDLAETSPETARPPGTPGTAVPPAANSIEKQAPPPTDTPRSLLEVAHELSSEIKTLVATSAKEGTIREELIIGLQGLLDKEPYRPLRNGPFKESINNLIRFDVEHNCSILFSTDELNSLWIR